MLQAAGELFVRDGYGATTLQDVARTANVAVQTIYFTFGNKRSLLKELVDVTIAGDDESVVTMDRPWFREALEKETAQEHLRAHITGTRNILDRVSLLMEMVTVASATDPEVAELWPGNDPRYTVQRAAAEALMAKPGACPEMSVEQAADVMYGLLSTELYLLFVRDRGWMPERWEEWAFKTLKFHLCEDEK